MADGKWKKAELALTDGKKIPIYAGKKVHLAIEEITKDMNLYHGVRLAQVLEAVYNQGQKEGRREIIEKFNKEIASEVKYMSPGQPKKNKKKK